MGVPSGRSGLWLLNHSAFVLDLRLSTGHQPSLEQSETWQRIGWQLRAGASSSGRQAWLGLGLGHIADETHTEWRWRRRYGDPLGWTLGLDRDQLELLPHRVCLGKDPQ